MEECSAGGFYLMSEPGPPAMQGGEGCAFGIRGSDPDAMVCEQKKSIISKEVCREAEWTFSARLDKRDGVEPGHL